MQIHAEKQGNALHVYVLGEIDEHSAKTARREADEYAQKSIGAKKAVLNLSEVSFMDSTGIGFLLGRYKVFKRFGIPLYIFSPSQSTDKILLMSGVYSLIPKI